MPGEYTFNDGSTLLQPIADRIGFSIDKLNLVLCMVSSLPLAIVYHKTLAKSSVFIRELYPLVIGLIYCWFCFGRLVFIFSMSYLTFVHFYRWKFLTQNAIDLTGPFMVSVQKVTTIAFSLHDGRVKKAEELTPLQKREAIRSLPSVLSYLSYLLHFQSVLTGPLSYYTDYVRLVHNEHVEANKDGHIPNPYGSATRKLLQSIGFLLLVCFVVPRFPPERILEEKQMGTLTWIFLIYCTMVLQRMQYYFAWYFADAVYNFSGYGFNGYDPETGEANWDLVKNVDAWKVESACSFKDTLDGWNCMTMGWLRRVAFDRAPLKYRTISTYVLSSWWHGLYEGYYLCFSVGALFTIAGKNFRRSMRWRFLGSRGSKFVYDVITFIGTKCVLAYTTFPFVMLHFEPGFAFYRQLYFVGHIIGFVVAAGCPLLFPPPRRQEVKEAEKTTLSEESKKDL